MNKFNKLLLSALPLFALTLMTSCDGPGTTIEDTVANQMVVEAISQMTTTQIDSFEIDVTADIDYLGKVYDDQLAVVAERHLDASGEVNVKVNDLFEDTAEGSVEVSASILAEENDEVLVNSQAGAALYLSEGWAYINLTEAEELFALVEEEAPDVLTMKTHVGNLATFLEIDPEEPLVMPIDVEEMLPYMNTIENISATQKDGELTVVYSVTMNDVVSLYMKVMEDSGKYDPSELTSDEIAEIRTMITQQLSSLFNITEVKLTIGVGEDGFLSKLYFDVDIAVTVPGGDDGGHELHEVDASLHVDINNMNKLVTVDLPTDLDTYTEVPTEEEPT
ncbi:MAG: hypothetical protein PHV19_00870 [Bacilli bacterium]|nr:hypothetical protein [Bacilli bacterium]